MATTYAYIGSWGKPGLQEKQGIRIARYDTHTGTFHVLKSLHEEINCGDVCMDAGRRVLYYVNERRESAEGRPGGEVCAFRIGKGGEALELIGRCSSFGLQPSFCTLDHSGNFLLVTNHSDETPHLEIVQKEDGIWQARKSYAYASLVLYPVLEDGSLGTPADVIQNIAEEGRKLSHLHSVVRSPSEDLFAVCDKGWDMMSVYRIDRKKKKLVLCGRMQTEESAAPRYAAFHPFMPYLYFNNEAKSVINMVEYAQDGTVFPICMVSCMENRSFDETGWQSDIRIHPSGKYMYALIRQKSSISVYNLEKETGIPVLLQNIAVDAGFGGRSMTFSPDGRFLHIAACPDDKIVTFSVRSDGTLADEGIRSVCTRPANIVFFSESDEEK